MTDKEIIQALRICFRDLDDGADCPNCPLYGNENCLAEVMGGAADLIERLTAENVILPDGQASAIESLRKEIEWKDMVIALAQRKQAEAEAERDAPKRLHVHLLCDDRRSGLGRFPARREGQRRRAP